MGLGLFVVGVIVPGVVWFVQRRFFRLEEERIFQKIDTQREELQTEITKQSSLALAGVFAGQAEHLLLTNQGPEGITSLLRSYSEKRTIKSPISQVGMCKNFARRTSTAIS